MQLAEIEEGKAYEGAVDSTRGFGSRRKVVEHNREGGRITFRNEFSGELPVGHVLLAVVTDQEFAAWAQVEVPTEDPVPAHLREGLICR